MSRRWLAVPVAAACLLAGCGSGARDVSETVTSRTHVPGAKPVTVRAAARALRAEHFQGLTISPAGGVPATEVDAGDGLLFCDVYDDGTSWGPTIEVRGPGPHSGAMWHGTKAYVFYMNMECQLYPADGYALRQTNQLVAAVRRVAGLGRRG